MAHGSKADNLLARIAGEVAGIRRETLTEQIVRHLKSLVIGGVIPVGQALPAERELAAMLRISRPTLRGALKVLQIMGVLEVRQGARTYLTPAAKEILSAPPKVLVPPRRLTQAELFEARRAIEAESAATAAERATESDLKKLETEFERMKACLANHDIRLYGRHDMAFHQAIAEASGNTFFVWFVAAVTRVVLRDLWTSSLHVDTETSLQSHEKILAAIQTRDRAAARAEMLHHLLYWRYFVDPKEPVDLTVPTENAPAITL